MKNQAYQYKEIESDYRSKKSSKKISSDDLEFEDMNNRSIMESRGNKGRKLRASRPNSTKIKQPKSFKRLTQ